MFVRTLEEYSLGQRVANAVQAYIIYLGQTVWPARLGVKYPLTAESLAGAFVYSQAPYLQSFVEVRVENSRGRVHNARPSSTMRPIPVGSSPA